MTHACPSSKSILTHTKAAGTHDIKRTALQNPTHQASHLSTRTSKPEKFCRAGRDLHTPRPTTSEKINQPDDEALDGLVLGDRLSGGRASKVEWHHQDEDDTRRRGGETRNSEGKEKDDGV